MSQQNDMPETVTSIIISPRLHTPEQAADILQDHAITVRRRLTDLDRGLMPDWPAIRIILAECEELLDHPAVRHRAELLARFGRPARYRLHLVTGLPLRNISLYAGFGGSLLLRAMAADGPHVTIESADGTTLAALTLGLYAPPAS